MIVLIPVSRFRITYEVAAGRPFSQLERMILSAIQHGTNGLDGLQDIFQVHPRLLIEGLVTLTQAGWLAIGGQSLEGFVLTSEGREAADSSRPPSTTAVFPRRAFVLMERLTGGLISNDEIRFVGKRDLAQVWEQSCRLSADVSDNRLDEGQVQHLLPRRQGEWVRWIGPIDMLTKGTHWLPVNVDSALGTVVGLPDAWLARLRPIVIEQATRFGEQLTPDGQTRTWNVDVPRRVSPAGIDDVDSDALRIPALGWRLNLSQDDFRFTGDEHERSLAIALDEASSSAFVTSSLVSTVKLEMLRPRIETALKRGVSVDVLWSCATDDSTDGRDAVQFLRKIAYYAKQNGFRGVLRFNHAPSLSNANLLLWDGPSSVRACVGSYSWLSESVGSGASQLPRDVSVLLSAPAATAGIARCAAALWSGAESEVLTSTADRWRRVASNLDMLAVRTDRSAANATIRLVLDREHEVLLREWLQTAQSRLLVASHRIGIASETQLASTGPSRLGPFSFEIVYGHNDGDDALVEGVAKLVRRAGGELTHVPNFHANAIVSDASACVTSYNFLSAKPFRAMRKARELGIAVDGAEPTEIVWRRLRHGPSQ